MRAALVLLVGLLLPDLAFSATLRLGVSSMGLFTRVTVDQGARRTVLVTHRGDQLSIRSDPPASSAFSSGHSALVKTTRIEAGTVVLVLRPGTSVRHGHGPSGDVIDLFASVPNEPALPPATVPLSNTTNALIPGLPSAFATSVDQPHPRLRPQLSAPAATARNEPEHDETRGADRKAGEAAKGLGAAGPATTQETLEAEPTGGAGDLSAALLPFSPDVGVAGLRRFGEMTLYFDEARPLDLSPFRSDPILSRASVTMQANFTELRLPLASDEFVTLTRKPGGWQLGVRKTAAEIAAIPIDETGTTLHFALKAGGKSLDAIDPVTGAYLLIGTDRSGRSAVRLTRRSATLTIDRTEFGVVVEAASDQLVLRAVTDGFSLSRDDSKPLHCAIQGLDRNKVADPSGLTRTLDLQADTIRSLWDRLGQQLLVTAKSAPRARLGPRLAAAQTMLALGLTREARSVVRVAMADDPLASADPQVRFVRAVTEFLCDPAQAGRLGDSGLPETDETRLWRALAGPHTPATTDAEAAAVRETVRLLLAYPDPLRDIAAGLAAPILLAHGSRADRDALNLLPSTPRTSVPQALASDQAVTTLTALTRDRDLKTSSDALLALLSLQVAANRLDPARAADILDRHRLDFRAVGEEDTALLREADLSQRAGRFAHAFALWHEIGARFPDDAGQAHDATERFLHRLAKPEVADRLSPVQFVSIVTQSAPELVASDGALADIAPLLAQRLEALDLPARAIPVLQQIMGAAPAGPSRAQIGNRLANLLLDEDSLDQAQDVLDRSEQTDLPEDLREARRLTRAKIFDRRGDHAKALATLDGDDGAPSRDLRASIEASLGRWHEAKLDLQALASHLRGTGPLGRDDGDLAIRLATAASRDNDPGLLTSLSRSVTGRFLDQGQQDTFNLLMGPLAQGSATATASGG